MQVILLTDVKKVGQRGTLATVADGYAQNVLLPKKLAVPATPENLKKFEREHAGMKAHEEVTAALAKKTLTELEGKTVTIRARANETGGLFEAIHPKQITEAIAKECHVAIPEEAIVIAEPIKKLGEFRVEINMHETSGQILIVVART